MTLSDIAAVRLNTSDKAKLKRDEWDADGVAADIELALQPVALSPVAKVYRENILLTPNVDYTLDADNGIVILSVTPAVNTKFVVDYYATVFSDTEIQHFLDTASANVFLASAYTLLAMAVEVARIARRETLAGGGVFGQATIDTSVRSKELREQAKSFIDLYNKTAGTDIPAEGLTQIIWSDDMGIRWTLNQLFAGVP